MAARLYANYPRGSLRKKFSVSCTVQGMYIRMSCPICPPSHFMPGVLDYSMCYKHFQEACSLEVYLSTYIYNTAIELLQCISPRSLRSSTMLQNALLVICHLDRIGLSAVDLAESES